MGIKMVVVMMMEHGCGENGDDGCNDGDDGFGDDDCAH